MKKNAVKEYLEKNANESVYMADELTKKGYGQTIGDYRNVAKEQNIENPTQKWHFTVCYYDDKKDAGKEPTYNKLHCPELLIWIAEVAGLDKTIISRAIDYLIDYEEKEHLKGTEKGAMYLGPRETEFKNLLHISEINQIIEKASDWTEVVDKVGSIKEEK